MHGSQSNSSIDRYHMVDGGIRTGITSNRGRLSLDGSDSWKERVDATVTNSPSAECLNLLRRSYRRASADFNISVLDWPLPPLAITGQGRKDEGRFGRHSAVLCAFIVLGLLVMVAGTGFIIFQMFRL
jgi:hypothetical protein